MDIYFYNTLTRKKELFEPLDSQEIRMYSCGPTVYKNATIGNMRTNIFQDVLRRMLRYNGYKIKHVMNITDVGHLVSDGDEGEDKMLKSAREEHKTPLEIAEHYTKLFFEDLKSLNVETPEIVCKATEHIKEMLEYVEKLMENGYAYETSTAIYFDISKLDKYPILSNLDINDQKAGARVDIDPEKRNPYDFALWIKAPENHLMKWDSPWGPSYPGWHIECSAMGRKYLGEQFDIHTGGIDLIPTHHENEIAQSKGACGKIPARYWMHGEYLLINGGKMSKSLGNVYLVKDIIEKGYEPLAYRLFCYSSHYRNKLNFTWEGIESAEKSLIRLRNSYQANLQGKDELTEEDKKRLAQIEDNFHKAINDDLNMPLAMSYVWELAKFEKKNLEVAKLLAKFDTVLGLKIDEKNQEKKEEKTIVGYRMVRIFDISQTKPIMEKTEEGNEIPCNKAQKLIDSLSYLKMVNLWAEDEEFQEELLAAAKDMIDIPVMEEELSPDLGGYFRFQDKDNLHIVLNNKFGITSRFTTLLHEWTHYHLHNPFKKETEWITEKFKKQDKEIQAESVAYIVAKHFGIDSSPESFKYVASWPKEKDIKDLKTSMEIIQKTAATFIELIETRLETEGFALKIHA